MRRVRFLRIAGYVSVSASVLCGSLLFASHWYRYQRGEVPFLLDLLHAYLWLAMLATTLAGGCLGLFALVQLFLANPADRWTLLRSIGAFALPVLLTSALLRLPSTRRAEFAALAERAQSLIEAIEQYERDHARPPYALAALVPRYLPSIPKTGHTRYPDFEYEFFDPGDGRVSLVWYEIGSSGGLGSLLGDFDYPQCGPTEKSVLVFVVEDGERVAAVETDRLPGGRTVKPFVPKDWWLHPEDRSYMIGSLLSGTDFHGMELQAVRRLLGQWNGEESFRSPPAEGVTWELLVRCSLGFLNWDEFFYWPTEVYPEETGSGSIERIGRWAYLHE